MVRVPDARIPLSTAQYGLLAQLSRLTPGQRVWFWLSPDHADRTPLMMTLLGEDPDMSLLKRAAMQAPLRAGAKPIIGLGSVEGGRLNLAAKGLSEEHLSMLSRWVRSRVQQDRQFGVLRDTVDRLKDKLGSAAVVLATVDGEKVRLVAGVTKDSTSRVKAGDLVNAVATQVGGRGGGRPDMAQAGGNDPSGLAGALESVTGWVEEQLQAG